MPDLSAMPGPGLLLALVALALVIVYAGYRLAATADKLADRTRLGEATVGAVLLGGSTSLPGIVTSVTAALHGYPQMAISNAIGGIAVQTFFLAVADMFYTRANLEHAAASVTNLFQAALLVSLLSLVLAANAAPVELTIGWVSIFTPVLFAAYLFGVRVAHVNREAPMWQPRRTGETKSDEDVEEMPKESLGQLVRVFLLLALVNGVAGWLLTHVGIELTDRTDLNETAIGGLVTGVITSLPELVTSIAAVRRGALNLAVGGILGGNAFDVLFLGMADVAHTDPDGIYAYFTATNRLVVSTTILMTAVLLMGLVSRQRRGGGIGVESWLVVLLYAMLVAVMAMNG